MFAGAKSGQRWGYHSLDPRVARRLVAASGIRPGDLVLDLGAGVGSLTAPLLAAGARVIAVELHPGRAAQLARRFAATGPDAVGAASGADGVGTASGADAVGAAAGAGGRCAGTVVVRRDDLTTTVLPRTAYRVVANPPWSTLESLRERLLRSPSLVRADLVVPRWVARRWAARYHQIAVGASIPAEAFRPSAPTGAAVAVIRGRHR